LEIVNVRSDKPMMVGMISRRRRSRYCPTICLPFRVFPYFEIQAWYQNGLEPITGVY
jgi:hypothetical protein